MKIRVDDHAISAVGYKIYDQARFDLASIMIQDSRIRAHRLLYNSRRVFSSRRVSWAGQ